jgi:CheY-like chemotaxis protein
MNILLIEENPDHVFLARQAILDTWPNATLLVARDQAEARVMLHQPNVPQRFDLLLTSFDLRNGDGLEQLHKLHTDPALRSTPLIALVSSTRDQELAQAAHATFDCILLKPLRAEALRDLATQLTALAK